MPPVKKWPGDPVRLPGLVELERQRAVREDVDEGQPVGAEPRPDARHHPPLVPDVLQHLDAHDPVEPLARLEGVGVGGHDLQVRRPRSRPPRGCTTRCDALLDTPRMRCPGGRSASRATGSPSRTPGPAPLPVPQLRPLGVQLEHGLLGLGEGGDPLRPPRAGVLATPARGTARRSRPAPRSAGRWRPRWPPRWAARRAGAPGRGALALGVHAARRLRADAASHPAADAGAQQDVRHGQPLGDLDGEGFHRPAA